MKIIFNPQQSEWNILTERPQIKQVNLKDIVEEVFANISKNGDNAILKYSRKFDFPNQKVLKVDKEIISQASQLLPKQLKEAIKLAKNNIERFHVSQIETVQKVETMPGVACWRENRPIEKVGIYIPGGTAPLFSTALMLGVPAKLAGCNEIVLCTPPDKNGEIHPAILYVAELIGIDKVFAAGGIQAIGAMTFGTESIPQVYKIFGPGNQYVMAAKLAAQSMGVAIDMPAGPSEVLIIADESSEPSFVAADLLSQAEHGPDSQVILLSNDKNTLNNINEELNTQLNLLPRKEIATEALKNSKAILLDNIKDCVAFSNLYAPEHLILAIKEPNAIAANITNAGSVFLGNYSCESAGDYASGTNHTLPTNGFARSYSGVSVDSFVKKITFQHISEEGITNIGPAIEAMAEAEQLFAHKNAVTLRLQQIINQKEQNI